MQRWCLVHAKTGRELEAEHHLSRQEYEVFLPRAWRTIRHARRSRQEKRALFPGYLFVHLDLASDQWRPINSTIGVVRLVTLDGAPATAPEGLIETLIEIVNEDGVIAPEPEWQAGERVRIISGAFADQVATIIELPEKDRVRVLLEMMQTAIPIDVDRAQIAKDA